MNDNHQASAAAYRKHRRAGEEACAACKAAHNAAVKARRDKQRDAIANLHGMPVAPAAIDTEAAHD